MGADKPPNWEQLAKFVVDGIGKKWVNEDYSEDYTVFITKHSLIQIWSDEDAFEEGSAFTVYKRLINQRELDKKKFEEKSILLVSALLYYGWVPDVKDRPCKPQNEGLLLTETNKLVTDDDLTLTTEQNKAIFGDFNVDFSEGQYRFCPAILDDKNGDGFIRLRRPKRLPFEYEHNEKKRHGWYGEVSRVRIKPGYLKTQLPLPVNDISDFACKTILHSRQDFHTEVRNLETIRHNALTHGHIVTHFIAVDVPPNIFIIVFPWAFTDLADLLRNPHPSLPKWLSPSAFNARNALKEVTWLASALDFLHKRMSSSTDNQRIALYHMDLKPDNVLIFEPQGLQDERDHPLGVWKITDFGLSDTKKVRMGDLIDSLESPDRSSDLPLQRRSGPYQGPEVECNHEFENCNIDHEKADIWSYGTVVAEVLAFGISGCENVQKMREILAHDEDGEDDEDGINRDSHYYHFADKKYHLCPDLSKFFEQDVMDSTTESSPWHQRVWSFLTQFVLHVDPKERYTAEEVSNELTKLFADAPSRQLVPTENENMSSTDYNNDDDDDDEDYDETTSDEYDDSTEPGLPRPINAPEENSPSANETPFASPKERFTPKCEKMTADSKSFDEHLASQHFGSGKSNFVVTNLNGTEAIFSDNSKLVLAHLPSSGGIECDGALQKAGKSKVEPYALQISGSLAIVRDSSQLAVHQFGGEDILLNTERLNAEIDGRHVVNFELSAKNRILLEYHDSINVIDLCNGDTLLQHEKQKTDGNFAAASFDAAGVHLFAISNDKYVAWRYQESDNQFVPELEADHKLVSDAHPFRPLLVPTNLSLVCLAQMRNHPETVYLLGPSIQESLELGSDKYRVSSRFCAVQHNSNCLIFCIGRRKSVLRPRGPKHVLLIWSISESSSGKPALEEPRQCELPTKLHSPASMETGLCARAGENPLAIIIEATGHVIKVPLM